MDSTTASDTQAKPDFFEKLVAVLQTIWHKYTSYENMKYVAANLVTINNAILLAFIIFLGLVFYRMGVNKGKSKAFTTLKQRYSNMELKKRRIRKSLDRTQSFYSINNFFLGFIGVTEVVVFVTAIYFAEYSHTAVTQAGLTRNLLLGGLGLLLLAVLMRRLAKYAKNKKLKEFTHFHTDEQDLAKDLLSNLGTDLTTLLKTALVDLDNKAQKTEITKLRDQILAQQQEILKQKQQIHAQQQESQQVSQHVNQQAHNALIAAEAQSRIKEAILRKDLDRYKEAMKSITDFEWCENCVKNALPHQEATKACTADHMNMNTKINAADSDFNPSEAESSTISESTGVPQEESKRDTEHESSPVIMSKLVPSAVNNGEEIQPCVENCLRNYFSMSGQVGSTFNQRGFEIAEMKKSMQAK